MKIIITLIIVLWGCSINAQWAIDVDFETPSITNQYTTLDTAPGNIWQIGKTNKKMYTQRFNDTNVIITELSNSYPINTNSSFTIKSRFGFFYDFISLSFLYKVDSDSLKDFGLVELSRDNGKTWANITETDTFKHKWVLDYTQYVNKPVFTGDFKNIWHSISYQMDNTYIKETDTVLFRFSFISDSIDNNRDGWMIDYISFRNYEVSIFEDKNIKNGNILVFYPNIIKIPSNFTIFSKNKLIINLKIYDLRGILLYNFDNPDVRIDISSSNFAKGLYFIRAITKFGNAEIYKFIIE